MSFLVHWAAPRRKRWETGSVTELSFKDVSDRAGTAATSGQLDEAFQQLQRAEQLRMRGEYDRARTICEPLVNRYPEYYGALHTLGMIYADKGQYPQALGCLVRACMLDPRSWKSLTALAGVYVELGANEMATRTLEQAKQIRDDEPSIHVTLADIYYREREYELAREAFRRAYELDQTLHAAAIGIANCHMDLGEYAGAADVLLNLTSRGVTSLPVLALINQLPSALVDLDVLTALNKVAPEPGMERADFENSVSFVRAAALHNIGKHEEAWQELERANRTLWPHAEHAARDLNDTQRANMAAVKDRRIKIRNAETGEPQTISLFILGPSRSGKTTMEALVGALPGVRRGYENPGIENVIRRTFQSAGLLTHRIFEALPPRLDSECCQLYLEDLTRRAGSAKVFTNTHPGRIHDAARIVAAIPNVRFIFIKRNLEDNLLRIFMQKYTAGNANSYDLEAIRTGLVWYHQMIDLLAAKLPDISRIISYEDMVADPTAALRSAANLCGLPMDHGALPNIGDDRDCSVPYRQFMATAVKPSV
jgi:Flp pilus assembly protein TadD